jgi:UDP-2,3-diacylglucosamine hydrolase
MPPAATAALATPLAHELHAPASWRTIEFISDLHLSEAGPHTVAALLAHLRQSDADAICLLGDIFEVWVGDDVLATPACAETALLQALADAARGRWIGYMHGNRDFLLGGAALQHCGWQALPDPTVLTAFGQRLLLSHGDALCLADHDYQRFRSQARNPAWQSAFLARPLAERRAIARQLRDTSEQHKQDVGLAGYADVDADAALAWLGQADTRTLLHGHTHRPGQHALDATHQRWVLSDWDLDGAVPRADLLRFSPAGLERRVWPELRPGAAADVIQSSTT